MNRTTRIAAAALFAVPFVAIAQTTLPADQPRTDLEKQQTQQQGAATKYGEPGSGAGQANRKDSKSATSKSASKAPKKDGTPNDESSTPTPMNTISPTTAK